MSKAYDRVEWLFLESLMVSMGFDMRWVNWIMNCVKSISYSFILNGEPRGRLIRSRGVRQGDYLTRYVCIMCGGAVLDVGEGRVKMSVSWCGYCSQCPPSINHLFFADDSFIFMRVDEEECGHVRSIFEEASGQCVSLSKNSICSSKNVDFNRQEELAVVV